MISIACITVGVLTLILATLYIEEYRERRHRRPRGTLDATWTGPERRIHQRFNSAFDIVYHCQTLSDDKKESEVKNISMGGVCLKIPEKLSEGSILDIEVNKAGEHHSCAAKGKVIWVNDETVDHGGKRYFLTGIQFIELHPSLTTMLEQNLS